MFRHIYIFLNSTDMHACVHVSLFPKQIFRLNCKDELNQTCDLNRTELEGKHLDNKMSTVDAILRELHNTSCKYKHWNKHITKQHEIEKGFRIIFRCSSFVRRYYNTNQNKLSGHSSHSIPYSKHQFICKGNESS